MHKPFDKLLASALLALPLLAPAPLRAVILPPPVQLPVPRLPDLPPVPDLASTLTHVGNIGDACVVYLLTHATGTQTIVVCTDAEGRPQVTLAPPCGS